MFVFFTSDFVLSGRLGLPGSMWQHFRKASPVDAVRLESCSPRLTGGRKVLWSPSGAFYDPILVLDRPCRVAWRNGWIVSECVHLSAAKGFVRMEAESLVLSRVQEGDSMVEEHPGLVLAGAAGAMPRLRMCDRASLPRGGSAHSSTLRVDCLGLRSRVGSSVSSACVCVLHAGEPAAGGNFCGSGALHHSG